MRLALLCVLVASVPALAHDLRPGILAFVEDAPGELRMRYVPPVDSRGEAQELPIVLPRGCTRRDDRVRCDDDFTGELAVGGMRGHAMKIYVSLERDGVRQDWVLTSEAPRLAIPPPRRTPFPVLHLALFAALLLAFPRRPGVGLAFVAAHVASGFAGLAFAPLVSLAVVFAAREAISPRMQAPVATAAVFGAVSGNAMPLVIAGELVALAALAIALRSIGERRIVGLRAHRAAAYALGALASYRLIAELASR